MAERSYVDFDLQIEWVGTGYRARVLESPAGQAQSDFSLPFSDLELENFILRIGQRRRGRRRAESKDLDSAREFGSNLFHSVFQGDIASVYRSSLLFADQKESGLRVRLRLSGAPDLGDVPWEFLFDPTARRFIALSADSPIVRFLDVPGVTTPLKVVPPLKVLVVIASPSDFEQLKVEDEWTRLNEALEPMVSSGAMSVERLEKPTLSALQRALRRDYHVLHFVGHGGFDEQRQDGLLVFEDDQGKGNEVSATYLSTLLHDADSMRLAVLNACEGARASRTDQFAGVAQSLLQQGVPAVVAMQFEISDDAALTFAREFYGAFAEGYPVEAALAEARKSMFAQQNDSEWATPVLYLRTHGDTIFQIAELPAPAPPVDLVPPVPVETPPEVLDEARSEPEGATARAVPETLVEPAPDLPATPPAAPEPEVAEEVLAEPAVTLAAAPEPAAEPQTPVAEALTDLLESETAAPEPGPPAPPVPAPTGHGGAPPENVEALEELSGAMTRMARNTSPSTGGQPPRPMTWFLIAAVVVIGAVLLGAYGLYAGVFGDDDDTPPADRRDENDDDDGAVVVVVTPTPTAEADEPVVVLPPDFTGTWNTNFARVVMTQVGREVTGYYQLYLGNLDPKTLSGTLEDRTLRGKTGDGSDFEFIVADDGQSFDGFWVSGRNELEWCGALESQEQPPGCGYSGEWQVKGLPPGLDLQTDSIYMTQLSTRVDVFMPTGRYGDITWQAILDDTTLAKAAGLVSLPPGSQSLRYEITFLVSDEEEYDAFQGSWRQTIPNNGPSGAWCAWRHEARPPC